MGNKKSVDSQETVPKTLRATKVFVLFLLSSVFFRVKPLTHYDKLPTSMHFM